MEKELKNNILGIIDSIENSVKLQEHQLDNRYKVLDSYAENDEVKKLCNDFEVYTQNAEQEDFCQKTLHKLLMEIKKEQDRKKDVLKKLSYIEYPMWANSLEILKEENCIVNYIRDSIECFLEKDDGKRYLSKLTGKSLKEELLDITQYTGTKEDIDFYKNFSEEDYDKAIEYAKIERNNEKIEYIEYDLEELERFSVMFSMIDYDNVRNIYASSLISIITSLSEPIRNIIIKKYSGVKCNSNRLTTALINLRDKYPNCFCIDGEDKYVGIMESIERRNMYIHNQGLVNNKYLTFGSIIKSDDWNKYGFANGDFLKIDSYYFENFIDLIRKFIRRL